jgi:HD-GYP domain-containing protein (c-di-GMP phosphodiesterase class II)
VISLEPLKPYANLLKVGAVVVAVAAAVWWFNGFVERQQQIGYEKAVGEYAAKQLEAVQGARAAEKAIQQKLNEAQNAAAERETKLRDDYAAAHAAALGLRNTLAGLRNGLPTATAAACRQTSATALDVFGECTAAVERLAAAADGHASDVKTLTDAWPK